MDANSGAGTYIVNVPRYAKDLICTGFTRTLQWTSGLGTYSYGSVTFSAGMTFNTNGAGGGVYGRGTHTITSAGKTFNNSLTFNCPGGSYTLNDAFTTGTNLGISGGTFNSNNFNITVAQSMIIAAAATANLGTSTITLTNTTTIAVFTNTSTTSTTSSASFVISTVSANTRTFAGGGRSYGTLTYTVAGSTGTLAITGANTFGTLNFSDVTNARTLTLPASATTTILNNFNVQGTAGKLMTVNSSTNGTTATLSRAAGTVNSNYLSLRDSTATGGASWYAGQNSTNLSNNSGWIFALPGAAGNFFEFFD